MPGKVCPIGPLVIGQFANTITANILIWASSSWRPTAPVFNTAVWNDVKFGGNLTASNLATYSDDGGRQCDRRADDRARSRWGSMTEATILSSAPSDR